MPEFIVKTSAALRADALFVSVLQRSDKPDAGRVRQDIAGDPRDGMAGADASAGNSKNNLTQSEHDHLMAFHAEGDEPE